MSLQEYIASSNALIAEDLIDSSVPCQWVDHKTSDDALHQISVTTNETPAKIQLVIGCDSFDIPKNCWTTNSGTIKITVNILPKFIFQHIKLVVTTGSEKFCSEYFGNVHDDRIKFGTLPIHISNTPTGPIVHKVLSECINNIFVSQNGCIGALYKRM